MCGKSTTNRLTALEGCQQVLVWLRSFSDLQDDALGRAALSRRMENRCSVTNRPGPSPQVSGSTIARKSESSFRAKLRAQSTWSGSARHQEFRLGPGESRHRQIKRRPA